MNVILIKMFATALALGQVTTRPDQVRTEFDPVNDRGAVVQILQEGCAHMRKAFDIEDLNLDDLISTALEDPQAVAGEIKAFRGINFEDLHIAYKQFCSNQPVENSPFDIGAVIEFYNKTVKDLPDHNKLKGIKLPGASVVYDIKGERFAELFESDHRRTWVPIDQLPEHVRLAFVSAEDKRFYEHKGIDERGLIRAFISNIASPGRPQGGSTITQQVAKNLLVGDDVSYERKIREMIVAARLDASLSKDEILEVYLNSIFLGRSSWGIDMAARSYFKKPAAALNLTEAALLAGMAKGPAYFSPDRFPRRAQERYGYVMKRMAEEKVGDAEDLVNAGIGMPRIVPHERPRRETGFHFVDHLRREARTLVGMQSLTSESYTVRSTINGKLQKAAEGALQEGLARYEYISNRARFTGPEVNLGETVARVDTEQRTRAQRRGRMVRPVWQIALQNARLPLYDIQWAPAIVVERRAGEGGRVAIRVGLRDGRTLPLSTPESIDPSKLRLNDVIYVRVSEPKAVRSPDGKRRTEVVAELRVRPRVQGAAIVLENKTGRILSMVGGFSYVQSQLNRTTQALRQPGSSIKPVVYLAALHRGLQPNTLVQDTGVTLPPIPGVSTHYWTPRNYDRSASGTTTLRRALEQSKNIVTARLLDGAVDKEPPRSLEMVCNLAVEAGIYKECMKNYPFVLGAQALRMIDLAGFYASIASEGQKVTPYAIDSIEQDGKPVYRRRVAAPHYLANGDRAAFFQLRSILEGVVTRGTATSIRHLGGYVGGKTGTTDNENDAWFAAFSSDVTVVVWVGYDNAGRRQTLGDGSTGGKLAVPIAESIFQAVWTHHSPKTPLPPPSAEIARTLRAMPIDPYTGQSVRRSPTAFMEHFRVRNGQVRQTQYALVSRGQAAMRPSPLAQQQDERTFAYPGPAARQAQPSRPPRTLRELFGLQRY